jgi:hypothetical protein
MSNVQAKSVDVLQYSGVIGYKTEGVVHVRSVLLGVAK